MEGKGQKCVQQILDKGIVQMPYVIDYIFNEIENMCAGEASFIF